MALQQLADRREHERQDDPLGLGELERALDRRLRARAGRRAGRGRQRRTAARRSLAQSRVERPRASPRSRGASTSSACSGSPSASWIAAAAMRDPGAVALVARPCSASAARGAARLAHQRLDLERSGRVRSIASACSPPSERLHPLRARGTRPAPPRAGPARAASRPARSGATSSVLGLPRRRQRALAPARATARPRRSARATASATAPTASAGGEDRDPRPSRAPRRSPPPRSLSRSPTSRRASRERRRRFRGGRGSRSPGRAVRCGARARAPPRGARRASSSSQRPQLGDAEVHQRRGAMVVAARRARLAGWAASAASTDAHRLAARRRDRRAGARARASRSASRRSKRRRRSSGTVVGQPLGDARCSVALSSSTAVVQPRAGEHERQLGVLRRRLAPERRRAARDSVAVRPSRTRLDVAVGEQARRVRPVAAGLRVADRLDRMPVLLEPLGRRRGAASRRSPGRSGAARAAAGRRTGGGSETTTARRRAR